MGQLVHCPRRLGVSLLRVHRKGLTAQKDSIRGLGRQVQEALAQKAVESLLLKLNSETPQQRMAVVTFGAICDRYIAEELPERYSTAKSYR
jgi:hypothetical protein